MGFKLMFYNTGAHGEDLMSAPFLLRHAARRWLGRRRLGRADRGAHGVRQGGSAALAAEGGDFEVDEAAVLRVELLSGHGVALEKAIYIYIYN